jgi:hypothetical protein
MKNEGLEEALGLPDEFFMLFILHVYSLDRL